MSSEVSWEIQGLKRQGFSLRKSAVGACKARVKSWRIRASTLLFLVTGALVPLDVLAELINMGTLAAFCLVSVAVIVLRTGACAGGALVRQPDGLPQHDHLDRVRRLAADRARGVLRRCAEAFGAGPGNAGRGIRRIEI